MRIPELSDALLRKINRLKLGKVLGIRKVQEIGKVWDLLGRGAKMTPALEIFPTCSLFCFLSSSPTQELHLSFIAKR